MQYRNRYKYCVEEKVGHDWTIQLVVLLKRPDIEIAKGHREQLLVAKYSAWTFTLDRCSRRGGEGGVTTSLARRGIE